MSCPPVKSYVKELSSVAVKVMLNSPFEAEPHCVFMSV
jgi:hypothetical protein